MIEGFNARLYFFVGKNDDIVHNFDQYFRFISETKLKNLNKPKILIEIILYSIFNYL